MNGTGRRRAHGAAPHDALRATLREKATCWHRRGRVATQVQESERSIPAWRSIQHAHAVREQRDAVARAHASHATCEAQLAEAATRSANARVTARSERGEAVAELAASWETVTRPQVIAGGVTVASVNAHVEALLALTARHNMHIAECKRLVRTDACALYDERATNMCFDYCALRRSSAAATVKYTLMNNTTRFFTMCASHVRTAAVYIFAPHSV